MEKKNLITAYKNLKKQLDKQRDSETLKKYKILSKAYKLGKQIHGTNFSVAVLSIDFELPYTTTKRVLSLKKANKRTWNLIKEKKISIFKVAMILLKKDTTFQDEIVDLVIEKNLSTYQIQNLKIKNLKDIQKERLRVAVQNGFARSDRAYASFKHTLERLEELLILKIDYLPKKKIPELKKKIKVLNTKLSKYLEKLK